MVYLAYAYDFTQHKPSECHHQCGADISWQEPSAGGSSSYTAVKSPGGAVHSHGESINIRIADNTAADPGISVTRICNGKKQAHIGEGKEKYGFCF